jgi:hypothetical protein
MSRFYLFLIIFYLLFPAIGLVQMLRHQPAIEAKANAVPSLAYQQGKRLLRWGLIAPAAALLSMIPLMGLPGAVVLAVGQFLGLGKTLLVGDKAWPAAILASLVFPLALPLGVVLKNGSENVACKLPLMGAMGIMAAIWGIVTILFLMWADRQSSF